MSVAFVVTIDPTWKHYVQREVRTFERALYMIPRGYAIGLSWMTDFTSGETVGRFDLTISKMTEIKGEIEYALTRFARIDETGEKRATTIRCVTETGKCGWERFLSFYGE